MSDADADTADAPEGGTEPCLKCETQISPSAKRCPECGYEPGSSTLSKVLLVFTLPWALLAGGGVLLAVVGSVAGLGVTGSVGTLAVFGVFGAPAFFHVWRFARARRMGPTG
jgi:ribosomal protein L40E